MTGGRLSARNWRLSLGGGQTEPQLFQCSDGRDWVLKLQGNPHMDVVGLCADWVGTCLAGMARVPTVQCELVHVSPDALWTMRKLEWSPRPGTAFGSLFAIQADAVTGTAAMEHGLSGSDLMRIVAVDTWLDVLDRKKPGRAGWNLLLDKETQPARVVSIDYGMGMPDALGVPILGAPPMAMQCPDEWRPWLHVSDIPTAMADINAIPDGEVEELVRSIPEDWRAHLPAMETISAWLLRRREKLEACLRQELGA
jgi:hypothetical protein